MVNFHPIPFDSLHNLDSAAARSTPARTTGTSSRSDQSQAAELGTKPNGSSRRCWARSSSSATIPPVGPSAAMTPSLRMTEFALEADGVRVHGRSFLRVEEGDEVPSPAREPVPHRSGPAPGAFVGKRDVQAPVEEGQFPEALCQHRERALRRLEDVGVGPKGNGGPASGRRSCAGGRGERDAPRVLLHPADSIAPHLGCQTARQGAGDTGPDTEEAHGHSVAAARLRHPGVHAGQQSFEAGTAGVPGGLDGDTGPVVGDTYAAVGREGDLDGAGTAGQDFVHRPFGDIEHDLVQATLAGRADVHSRPLPNGFQSLQHLDAAGVVRVVVVTHQVPPNGVSSGAPA